MTEQHVSMPAQNVLAAKEALWRISVGSAPTREEQWKAARTAYLSDGVFIALPEPHLAEEWEVAHAVLSARGFMYKWKVPRSAAAREATERWGREVLAKYGISPD